MNLHEANLKKIVEEIQLMTSADALGLHVSRLGMVASLKRLKNGVRFCENADMIDADAADQIVDFLLDQIVNVEQYGKCTAFTVEERRRRGLLY